MGVEVGQVLYPHATSLKAGLAPSQRLKGRWDLRDQPPLTQQPRAVLVEGDVNPFIAFFFLKMGKPFIAICKIFLNSTSNQTIMGWRFWRCFRLHVQEPMNAKMIGANYYVYMMN